MIKNIIFSKNGAYVEKIRDLYHVFVPNLTHASCDSAYKDKSIAIERCKYLGLDIGKDRNKLAFSINYKLVD